MESCELDGERWRYGRTLRLPSGPARVELTWGTGPGAAAPGLTVRLELADPRDTAAALLAVRRLCDLDVDPAAVARGLGGDEHLGLLVDSSPGLRVPGTADVQELLFRALVGQQISLAGAASCAGKLVAEFGTPYPGGRGDGRPDRLFPTAAALAGANPDRLPMPRARGRALVELAETLATGRLLLSADSDPVDTRARLLRCRGIGPWTADYVLMRGLHCADVLLASDLVIKRELARRRITDTSAWAPWRSYATMLLWRSWTG